MISLLKSYDKSYEKSIKQAVDKNDTVQVAVEKYSREIQVSQKLNFITESNNSDQKSTITLKLQYEFG